MKATTIFSHGLGTDSSMQMELFAADKNLRDRHIDPTHRVWCIFSDLGLEYPETMAELPRQRELAESMGWEFIHLTPDMGFHPNHVNSKEKARNIQQWWKRAEALGMVSGDKRCTARWKVDAIWNYISDRVEKELGIDVNNKTDKIGRIINRKKALDHFTKAVGEKFKVVIGFAFGEEKRIKKSNNPKSNPKWFVRNVERCFPLADMMINRDACNKYYETRLDRMAPRPSNCMFCFYQSPAELLYLFRYHNKMWRKWAKLEYIKIQARGGNGACGRKNLSHYTTKALKYTAKGLHKPLGQMTKEELRHQVQYHGGCGKNAV